MSSPGRLTAIPSAMVSQDGSAIGSPAASEAGKDALPAAWTPTMRTSGRSARKATAIPEMSPPPPTHTTTVVASGTCAAISRPTVPCPAMMSGWSNGWTKTRPCSAAYAVASVSASSKVPPTRRTSAPYPIVASTFGSGASTGMKTVASTSCSAAARATPWAWLPADAQTTPWRRSSSESCAIRL